MMSNLCTPWGALPPKKFGGRNFSHPLGSGGMVQNFSGNSPEKKPKTGFKILGAPPPQKKNCRGLKVSPNFAIFRLFCPFLQNGARYRKSKNWFVIYRHSSTRRWRNGVHVLLSSMNYVIRTRIHPPSDLIAGLYTKRLTRGHSGRRYSNSTH